MRVYFKVTVFGLRLLARLAAFDGREKLNMQVQINSRPPVKPGAGIIECELFAGPHCLQWTLFSLVLLRVPVPLLVSTPASLPLSPAAVPLSQPDVS